MSWMACIQAKSLNTMAGLACFPFWLILLNSSSVKKRSVFFLVSPDLLAIADFEGHLVKLSKSWTDVLGYPLPDIQNHLYMDFVHPDDMAVTRKISAAMSSQKEVVSFINRFRHADGSYRFLEWRSQPYAGKIYVTARDITERRQMETTIQERVNELTCLHEVGRLIEMPGLSEAQFCERVTNLLNQTLLHPELVTSVIEIKNRRYQSGNAIDPRGEQITYNISIEGQAIGRLMASYPEGTRFQLPFEQNLVNNLASTLSLWIQRKKYQSEMRKFAQAVDQCATNIVITNTFGIIEYVNPAFSSTTGYSQEEVIGQNPRILQSGLTPSETYENLWRTIHSGKTWRGEFCNRTKSGELYWEISSISCIRDETGKITHFLAVKEDITARKQDQERIAEALAFNKTILDASPFGILIYKASGQCVSANAAAGLITGKSPEDLLQHDFHASKSWKQSGLYQAAMTTLETRVPVTSSAHYVISTGREIWLNYTFNAFAIGGETHLLHMFQDDSLRQQAEEKLKLTNEKLETIIKDLEVSKRNSDLLRQMGDMLQVCHEVKEAHDVIRPFIPELFPESRGSLFMIDPKQRMATAVLDWGEPMDSDLAFSMDDCWSLRRNQPHTVNTLLPGPQCKHMAPTFKGIYIDLPLTASGETFGLLHLEWPARTSLASQEQELAQTMVEHISLALANIRLRERLLLQSVRDPLTGAFNRRYMQETLDREIMRAQRYRKPIGLLVIDIDFFKKFNDNFGHAAGDFVLKILIKVLEGHVRGSDVVCRMGGEEFLVILPDAGRDVVLQRAESIRNAVEELKLEYDDKPLAPMTVSIGVAVYPQHGETDDELLKRADDALYIAKNSGRNRVAEAGKA